MSAVAARLPTGAAIRLCRLLGCLLLAGALLGCGSDDDTTVVVGAASSLADFLEEAAVDSPVPMELNLAGSQSLVAGVAAGAPMDILITADLESLQELGVGADRLANNQLGIIVAAGNPLDIRDVFDLPDRRVILADTSVPAGRYAADYLEELGVDLQPIGFELAARSVVLRVASGEADAGIAYLSDGSVQGVDSVALDDAPTTYWIAVIDPQGQEVADYLKSRLDLVEQFGLRAP